MKRHLVKKKRKIWVFFLFWIKKNWTTIFETGFRLWHMGIRGGAKKSKVGFAISFVWFPILHNLDRHHAKFEGPR